MTEIIIQSQCAQFSGMAQQICLVESQRVKTHTAQVALEKLDEQKPEAVSVQSWEWGARIERWSIGAMSLFLTAGMAALLWKIEQVRRRIEGLERPPEATPIIINQIQDPQAIIEDLARRARQIKS